MQRSTWKVSDLVFLVLSAAMAFGAFRYYSTPGPAMPPPMPNAGLLLTSFLALLAMASLGAFRGRPGLRRPCQGFAAFGWCQLAFVLWGGYDFASYNGALRIADGSQMGMAFGAVCAVVAGWTLEPPRDEGAPVGKDRGRDGDATGA
jgi:hypothetical protein